MPIIHDPEAEVYVFNGEVWTHLGTAKVEKPNVFTRVYNWICRILFKG